MFKYLNIFVLVFLLGACNQTRLLPATDPSEFEMVNLKNILVPCPKKWTVETGLPDDGIILACKDTVIRKDDVFVENLHVRFYPGIQKTMNEIINENKNDVEKRAPNGRISEIELPNPKTGNRILKFETNVSGVQLCGFAAFYIYDDDLYVLNFIYETKNYDDYFPIFRYIAENIEFHH